MACLQRDGICACVSDVISAIAATRSLPSAAAAKKDSKGPASKSVPGSMAAVSTPDEGSTVAAESDTTASDMATEPSTPKGDSSSLLSCPLHDALAFFLVSKDLARLSHGCRTLRVELTVEGLEASTGQRLLLVPVVELRIETAEAELARVSLPHIHTLRVMHRLSFNALADFVKRNGSQALWSLDKFACRGVRLHPHDVTEMLVPILSTTRELKLLNLQNNVIVDATVQRLCESGILDRVETLNLRFNKVGNEGAKAIAAAGKNLRWINLKMNMVGDEGALALAAMVRESNTIQLLNLRRQAPGLTDRAAFGFAEMLKANVSLEKLRLRRNRITDKGVAALAAVAGERLQRLCAHRPIWEAVYLELDFEENRVTDEGALSLLRMASSAPARARLEVLLHGNKATRDSLSRYVAVKGEALDSCDRRVAFESKPEFDA